jgi:hypothetical protein
VRVVVLFVGLTFGFLWDFDLTRNVVLVVYRSAVKLVAGRKIDLWLLADGLNRLLGLLCEVSLVGCVSLEGVRLRDELPVLDLGLFAVHLLGLKIMPVVGSALERHFGMGWSKCNVLLRVSCSWSLPWGALQSCAGNR